MIQWELGPALWGIGGVVALAVVLLRLLGSRRAALEKFAEAGLIDRLVARLDTGRRRTRLGLRTAALALLVVAIAGPRWGFQWQEVRREGIDLIIALDTSRSMLAADVAPNRLERAKLAVLDLLERLQGDRVGLVAFAGTAFLECPLTQDYSAFARSLRALQVGIIPRGGTALGRALDTALESFDAREGKYQALVLITDGEDHEGDVAEASKRVAAAAVKVYTVGIGTTEGELLPAHGEGAQGFFKDRQGRVVKSRLDEATLEAIARDTGGAYVRGLGPSLGLGEVFDDHIAKMERRDIGTRLERRWEPRFQVPLALALVLLLAETALGDARRTRRLRLRLPRARSRAAAASALLAVALLAAPRAAGATKPAVEGYHAYEQRQYGDAASRWREALLDEPDSRLLRFNLGVALYRDGKFDEAAQSFASVVATADPQFKAQAAYNWGNSLYRQGDSLAESKPQEAITTWEQALGAYASAMAADPADTDPKFGFELTAKRLRELRDKLAEEQKKQQEQQQQPEQPQDQPQQDQQQQDGEQQAQPGEQQESGEQQPDEQQAGEPQEQPQQGDQQQAAAQQPSEEPSAEEQANAGEPQPEEQAGDEQAAQPQQGEGEPEAAAAEQPTEGAGGENGGGEVIAGDGEEKDLDRAAARAVLDTARREELGPADVRRPDSGAALAEPAEDW